MQVFKKTYWSNLLSLAMSGALICSSLTNAQAQSLLFLHLPPPGQTLERSPDFVPLLLKGLRLNSRQPFTFEFILDSGTSQLMGAEYEKEAEQLVQYFLAALTVPQKDLWVNLSPLEQNRIIPDELGQTSLGRDMLAQDYVLKQLASSMLDPDKEYGQSFWNKVYDLQQSRPEETESIVSALNKVWIKPDRASLYEGEEYVLVLDSRLKVLVDRDHSSRKDQDDVDSTNDEVTSMVSDDLLRLYKEEIIPQLELEINHGTHFAPLRQIHTALILAQWFKEQSDNFLVKSLYVDQKKTEGITLDNPDINLEIYDQYVEAYKTGVFNYVREHFDSSTQQNIPQQYFAGGEEFFYTPLEKLTGQVDLDAAMIGDIYLLDLNVIPQFNTVDSAVLSDFLENEFTPDNLIAYLGQLSVTLNRSNVNLRSLFDGIEEDNGLTLGQLNAQEIEFFEENLSGLQFSEEVDSDFFRICLALKNIGYAFHYGGTPSQISRRIISEINSLTTGILSDSQLKLALALVGDDSIALYLNGQLDLQRVLARLERTAVKVGVSMRNLCSILTVFFQVSLARSSSGDGRSLSHIDRYLVKDRSSGRYQFHSSNERLLFSNTKARFFSLTHTLEQRYQALLKAIETRSTVHSNSIKSEYLTSIQSELLVFVSQIQFLSSHIKMSINEFIRFELTQSQARQLKRINGRLKRVKNLTREGRLYFLTEWAIQLSTASVRRVSYIEENFGDQLLMSFRSQEVVAYVNYLAQAPHIENHTICTPKALQNFASLSQYKQQAYLNMLHINQVPVVSESIFFGRFFSLYKKVKDVDVDRFLTEALRMNWAYVYVQYPEERATYMSEDQLQQFSRLAVLRDELFQLKKSFLASVQDAELRQEITEVMSRQYNLFSLPEESVTIDQLFAFINSDNFSFFNTFDYEGFEQSTTPSVRSYHGLPLSIVQGVSSQANLLEILKEGRIQPNHKSNYRNKDYLFFGTPYAHLSRNPESAMFGDYRLWGNVVFEFPLSILTPQSKAAVNVRGTLFSHFMSKNRIDENGVNIPDDIVQIGSDPLSLSKAVRMYYETENERLVLETAVRDHGWQAQLVHISKHEEIFNQIYAEAKSVVDEFELNNSQLLRKLTDVSEQLFAYLKEQAMSKLNGYSLSTQEEMFLKQFAVVNFSELDQDQAALVITKEEALQKQEDAKRILNENSFAMGNSLTPEHFDAMGMATKIANNNGTGMAIFHNVMVNTSEGIQAVYKRTQEIIRDVLGADSTVLYQKPEDVHVTIASDDIAASREALTLTLDQLKDILFKDVQGVKPFTIQLIGPHLMGNGAIIMEYTTSAAEFYHLRALAQERIDAMKSNGKLSEGNRAFVPNILHSTVAVIRDQHVSRGTLLSLYEELRAYRESLIPIDFTVKAITVVELNESDRSFVESKDIVLQSSEQSPSGNTGIEESKSIDAAQLSDLGGIDFSEQLINSSGKSERLSVDAAMVQAIQSNGFTGFKPLIVNVSPIESVYRFFKSEF